MVKRTATWIGLIVGGIITLSGFAAGEELPGSGTVVSAPQNTARLEQRMQRLQREYRHRNHAAALLSDVSLFDEGAIRGRSVRVVSNELLTGSGGREVLGPPRETQGVEIDIGYEGAGIGSGNLSGSTTDIEALKAEIRTLQRRLREGGKGGQRP